MSHSDKEDGDKDKDKKEKEEEDGVIIRKRGSRGFRQTMAMSYGSFQRRAFVPQQFFPDANELSEAKRSLFRSSPCRLSHLTSPSGLSEIPGFSDRVDFGKKDDDNRGEWEEDKVFFVAYPHFNVNEMIAVQELYESIALPGNQSLIVLNGELDRVRSGYYPRFFYPKLGRMRDDFLPKFETVYYVHNFKGREGGALFRVYKTEYGTNRLQLVHTQEEMPSLKEVALDILPAVGRR
eukprot:jgi/Chlat1/9248/Chrsp99S08519